VRNEGYTPGWGTFCLWSALFFPLSLVPRVSFLSFPGGSRVRGWTATSLLVWVCARLLGSRPRVDLFTLFSSPEPCCRRRLGRASQVRDEQPAVPKLRRRDGARPRLPRSRPNERACDTCRREARARGPRRRVSRSGHRGTTRKREVATPISFSLHWVLCKCLWEAPSPLK